MTEQPVPVLSLHAEPAELPGHGHAWLTIRLPDGTVSSLSLRPEAGLCSDLEIGRPSTAVREVALDDAARAPRSGPRRAGGRCLERYLQ